MKNPMLTRTVLSLVLAAGYLNLPFAPAAEMTNTMEKVKTIELKTSARAKVDYLLFLPKDYNSESGKRWPLMLFLHGAGERGSDVWKVAVHGPPKIVASHPDFPFIVVSPQCPEGEIWADQLILALLDRMIATLKVDTNRVYLTGLSMGGYGTWSIGLKHPERFAAIVPICGGGTMIDFLLAEGARGEALKTLGIWAFHGGKDPVVPVEESQRMIEGLKRRGLQDVKLTVYPEAGHDSWTQAYDDPALYDWLLAHERKP